MLAHVPAKHALGLDPWVDAGSPTRNMRKRKNREHIPIPKERNMF
jgi:hypothetical protein